MLFRSPLTNQTTFNISSNVVNNIKIKHNITKRSIPSLNWDDIKYQEPTISEYDKCVQNMEYFNTILSPSGEIIKPTGFFGFMKMTVSRLACVFKKYVTISKILRNSRELENLHIFNNLTASTNVATTSSSTIIPDYAEYHNNIHSNNTSSNIRKKRNIFTPMWSYITGLASQEDINKVQNNEILLAQFEKQQSENLNLLENQTETMLSALQNQNVKLAKLFSEETEVKQTLKTLLQDSGNALNQIQALAASLEIYSDVHMEYQSFLSLLSLLPYIIGDMKESITEIGRAHV